MPEPERSLPTMAVATTAVAMPEAEVTTAAARIAPIMAATRRPTLESSSQVMPIKQTTASADIATTTTITSESLVGTTSTTVATALANATMLTAIRTEQQNSGATTGEMGTPDVLAAITTTTGVNGQITVAFGGGASSTSPPHHHSTPVGGVVNSNYVVNEIATATSRQAAAENEATNAFEAADNISFSVFGGRYDGVSDTPSSQHHRRHLNGNSQPANSNCGQLVRDSGDDGDGDGDGSNVNCYALSNGSAACHSRVKQTSDSSVNSVLAAPSAPLAPAICLNGYYSPTRHHLANESSISADRVTTAPPPPPSQQQLYYPQIHVKQEFILQTQINRDEDAGADADEAESLAEDAGQPNDNDETGYATATVKQGMIKFFVGFN
ncbi:unnamed protein product [Ceratitis capitata]|uniref:(Mediterranean fruit fly) hypothetical protein n=1 Tax=Ceratitis capitata TaxID=7213 RepID=A0A811UHV7_CERCA|nr:unnamed protein product [Ceratitis capitata]